MRKIIIGLLMVFLLSTLVACAQETATPTSSTPAPSTTVPGTTVPPPVINVPLRSDYPLQVKGTPNVTYSLPGQSVDIKLTFTNTSSEPITLNLFPAEISINPPGIMQSVRLFVAGNTNLNLAPGETITQTLHWDEQDNNGVQVSPGWYVVNVHTTYVHEIPPKTTRQSFGETAKIYIQYPQGTMEKTIETSQSQTVNGITITLERAELSAEGAMFYCFVVPPGYTPSQSVTSVMNDVHARYSFDDTTRDAGLAGWGTRDNGIKLIWGNPEQPLDPVPNDARELTFIITRFGDVDGPWEFKIPLE